ncbi:MAG: ADP-ribosylation factor-like protein [Promethearchaeia archaeon]
MLKNIFLLKGKNFQHLRKLNIYNYPEEIIKISDEDLISKIIYTHDLKDIVKKYKSSKVKNNKNKNTRNKIILFEISKPIPQIINGLNLLTSCINNEIIIGLIFEKDDNPYDYLQMFEELLNELLNVEKTCSFNDEIEIENFLVILFIDIRRYGDENVEQEQIKYEFPQNLIKVFLFGLDEVGKSSLLRRLKTGEFDDNYFMPTRKFNIEYIPNEEYTLVFFDMPGQKIFRKKWLLGVQDSNVLIYMIDISNQIRFKESKHEFWTFINRYEFAELPILILGNKIDLLNNNENSTPENFNRLKEEIINYFEFDGLIDRKWEFIFTSVKTNYNIDIILDKIFEIIEV